MCKLLVHGKRGTVALTVLLLLIDFVFELHDSA